MTKSKAREDLERISTAEEYRKAYNEDSHADVRSGNLNPYFSSRRAGYSHREA